MFSFQPDELQRECFKHIDNNDNLLVSMPTGCGKTAIGIYAISKHINKVNENIDYGKIIYTTPIKSLSNEKYKDLREIFGNDNVGIMTGDNQINPDANVVIMTTEILRNDLYKKELKLSCVIFDEVHYINDEDRGTIWEESLILLDPSVQLILLSATISKPHDFTNWIETIKKKPTQLVITNKRPVPLIHYVWNDGLYKIMENDTIIQDNFYYYKDSNKSAASNILKLLEYLENNDLLQAIFFSFSRKMCEKFADSVNKSFVTQEESTEIKHLFEKYMSPFKQKYEKLGQYYKIYDLILKGIAYHHSGLAPILKEIVEILFKKKLLKVLFVTETFAVGINMPTRTVIFTELIKYTKQKRRNINVIEYKQMSGRAGRRGIDKIGNVIIMADNKTLSFDEIRYILTGNLPMIVSKLHINYHILLKLLLSNNLTLDYIVNLSMFGRDLKNNINDMTEKMHSLIIEDLPNEPNLKKLYEYDNMLKNMFFSKQQLKIIENLRKKCDKNDYEKYKIQKKIRDEYKFYEKKIIDEQNKILNLQLNLCNIMEKNGFIMNNVITQKGIIAACMNECNSLLITDMLFNNLFDDLTCEEIAGLLAIFVDDNKESEIDTSDLISKNISKKINNVKSIIEKYKNIEGQTNIENNDFWNISLHYVDPIFMWASGNNISKEIYEGNFIKGVIKVINIIKNLITMCEIYENYNLANKLLLIEPLLIREYVTTSSLYIL